MIPVSLFLAFAFGYVLTLLFRVVNAVAGAAISAELGIDPAAFGFLSSVYFLAFAAIQLPLGLLLDRYGPHRVEASLLVVAAVGALVFSLGESLLALTIGRALMGLGVAAGLMAAFKAYAERLPHDRLPLANGLHMALGGLGVLVGGLPAELAMATLGWRGLFVLLAGLAVVGAAALLVAVPDRPSPGRGDTLGRQIRDVGRIVASPAFLRLAPFSVATQASVMAVQALWVGPWLRDVAGHSGAEAAAILSMMACATILGYASCGVISTRLARRGVPVSRVLMAGTLGLILVQPAIILVDPGSALPLWLAFAFLGAFPSLSYPTLGRHFPGALAGRVNTALNFAVFTAAFSAQWAFGLVVAHAAPRLGLAGAYDVALWSLVALQATGLLWYGLRRPASHLRQEALASRAPCAEGRP